MADWTKQPPICYRQSGKFYDKLMEVNNIEMYVIYTVIFDT